MAKAPKTLFKWPQNKYNTATKIYKSCLKQCNKKFKKYFKKSENCNKEKKLGKEITVQLI